MQAQEASPGPVMPQPYRISLHGTIAAPCLGSALSELVIFTARCRDNGSNTLFAEVDAVEAARWGPSGTIELVSGPIGIKIGLSSLIPHSGATVDLDA